MSRSTLTEKLAAICAATLWLAAFPADAQVSDLAFEDGPACRVNEIPLGQPARVDARRDGARFEVRVAANFGCATTAGNARADLRNGEIHLSASTVLPGHPTPACKCTRHLTYRFSARAPAGARIVFLKDGQVEGEGTLAP